ncbi:hypothetical protein Achl_3938 (plasmid) [Pseudarthrobacter chlorophenolicus A6]|uniref:Uncharacterized protein n=1 Tax=Pseudarthrobacter chlorophenolicus (strain ATCC 700700 / DSM 12829 / CIP 107037 / JCM 12360 / KCTC 9906 / NCIMB 13794 / A6) TaxID=452863 RepID=B8HHJ2_PSECP|nr:hypothetical protein [Pseudarthrobacter chlorophenolicus]ACL41889.1 hypothetical protein Achl_3938 [Pseudarthrobacter chlorophenolicus A6]SDQ18213.1 hypothetical protein SAMN04489738_0550 [Pseudarthrobacter chlorophenolicus]
MPLDSTMPYTSTFQLEPEADEAHLFPSGTTQHIELQIRAYNRHAAISLMRAFGGELQSNVLHDWIGDPATLPAGNFESAYEKVHYPHISLTAAGSHDKDHCEVMITAPSIKAAHYALRLAASSPDFYEQVLDQEQGASFRRAG